MEFIIRQIENKFWAISLGSFVMGGITQGNIFLMLHEGFLHVCSHAHCRLDAYNSYCH